MNNKFVIITTCYNVNPYLEHNITVNKFQSHTNCLFVYVDDQSKDGSYETLKSLTKDDDRFIILKNPNNGSQAKAYMCAIDYLEQNNLIFPEDIIVEVDGDDWLSSTFVLEYINEIYQNPNIWMTYGQYQMWPNGKLGGHYSMDINDAVNKHNQHRNYPFPYSHLKTYKYWLFNNIDRSDLIDPTTNELYSAAWDHVLCLPMVEMAGKNHIHRCDDVLYILNRHDELQNEGKTRVGYQKEVETRCRQGKVYGKITRTEITCDLLGPGTLGGVPNFGLGNLMFQIAALTSLAKDNEGKAFFPQIKTPEYGRYDSNILNKVPTSPLLDVNGLSREFKPDKEIPFGYTDISYKPYTKYRGYFQSEKYFIHNRELILDLFKNQDIIKEIKHKYPHINDKSVSLHVRRGDYVQLSDAHPLQTKEYYDKALNLIPGYENVFIFSDDIEWCKNNLNYDNCTFVENNPDYFDLLAMSLCNHNIIANSTFSWWGAWLNENLNKKIIAPKQWFGVKRANLPSEDIIPKTWITI